MLTMSTFLLHESANKKFSVNKTACQCYYLIKFNYFFLYQFISLVKWFSSCLEVIKPQEYILIYVELGSSLGYRSVILHEYITSISGKTQKFKQFLASSPVLSKYFSINFEKF
jgi:hypothetical protein